MSAANPSPGQAPDSAAFRAAMGAFPTAVTVVTALGEHGPSGATVNAVSSLSLEPLMMLACLDRDSRTLRSIGSSGLFGVNLLAADGEELARRFSRKDPEPEKWDGIEWAERAGSPALAGALVWVGCELRDLVEAGDHAIATGTVLDLDASDGEPLVFHRGVYRPLG
jgi:3-hydroxy-9,10-secoandrosta-1,3,5(10)-triene-9,17-dione monooxygenase reductase component